MSKKKPAFKITPEIEEFIESYTTALRGGTAAIFAGAGLSKPAGFVDWRQLLKGIAKELKLNVDYEFTCSWHKETIQLLLPRFLKDLVLSLKSYSAVLISACLAFRSALLFVVIRVLVAILMRELVSMSC